MSKGKEYKLGEITKHNILGDIPNSWLIVKFESVVELIHGYQFRTNDFTENGIKVFKITQIKGDGIIDIENCDFIAVKRLESFKKNILNYNDILMALTGATIGKIARFKSNEVCLQNYRVGKFISRDKMMLSEDYLYYFLSSKLFYHQLLARQTQSAQQNIGKEDINNMSICFPSLPTQTAIAEILSSLDDKIELNNQINKDLEALAQALFKQWFIDFDFPNENGEPYRSSGGEMADSELGEIPKGWKVFYLNEIANCFDNKRIPLSSMERAKRKGSYPYYGAASLMDYVDDFIFDGVYLLIGEDGSVTDNLGYPVIQYVFGKFWTNNHAHVLQGTNISTELLMCLMKNTNIEHLVTGAVQPKLNQGNMNKICIALPNDISIIKSIEESINVFFEQVRENISENNQLISLREFLLPKLISGELEVSDIQSNTL